MALHLGRLRGKRKKGKRQRLLTGVPLFPTLMTLGNAVCGLAAVLLSIRALTLPADSPNSPETLLFWGGMLIFLAMIFDVLDGQVARMTKTTGRFGAEMDSLCDAISFGLSPAVLSFALITHFQKSQGAIQIWDRYSWMLLAAYMCCAVLRLARFNVESSDEHQDFFWGLPSPAAAGCVVGLVVLATDTGKLPLIEAITDYIPLILPFFAFGVGVLMVTRVHYSHLGEKFLRGRKPFLLLPVVILALILISMQTGLMMAIFFNGYMLLGLIQSQMKKTTELETASGLDSSAVLTSPESSLQPNSNKPLTSETPKPEQDEPNQPTNE